MLPAPTSPSTVYPAEETAGLSATTTTAPSTTTLAPPPPASLAQNWAQAFNLWLNARTSPHTRRAYSSAWTAFQTHTGKLPWEITRADIALWLDSQRASGLSASTINQRLAALSSFFTYASQVFMIKTPDDSDKPLAASNPAESIPRLKSCSYTKSHYLTVPEARALLRAIRRYSVQGLRDYALFLTYLVTGRRNSEVRTLRMSDFEFDGSTLYLDDHETNRSPSPIDGRGTKGEGCNGPQKLDTFSGFLRGKPPLVGTTAIPIRTQPGSDIPKMNEYVLSCKRRR